MFHADPFGIDSVSPRIKKQHLRDMLGTGKKRRSKKPLLIAPSPNDNDADMDPAFRESPGGEPYVNEGNPQEQLLMLDRAVRWESFVSHNHYFLAHTVRKIYGANITADHTEWQHAKNKFYDNIKAYKLQVLTAIEAHVRNFKRDQDTMYIAQEQDPDALTAFFEGQFSADNFLACWPYLAEYLDVDNSTDLGKYYCKSIYANLCREVKLYMDKKDTPEEEHARKILRTFYDKLPIVEDYDDVSRADFDETSERARNERRARVQDAGNRLIHERFTSVGGAPPPRRSRAPASGGNQDSPSDGRGGLDRVNRTDRPEIPPFNQSSARGDRAGRGRGRPGASLGSRSSI